MVGCSFKDPSRCTCSNKSCITICVINSGFTVSFWIQISGWIYLHVCSRKAFVQNFKHMWVSGLQLAIFPPLASVAVSSAAAPLADHLISRGYDITLVIHLLFLIDISLHGCLNILSALLEYGICRSHSKWACN